MIRCARLFLLSLVLLLFAACGGRQPAPAPEAAASTEAPKSTTETLAGVADGLVMSGIQLFLYDKGPAVEGVTRKPVLRIEADKFTMLAEKEWAFEGARAFFTTKDEGEEYLIEAAQGNFKEDEHADLKGGVVAHMGAMTIKMEQVLFENAAGEAPKVARSETPVTVDDPGMQLEASGVRLFPDEKRFELDNVTGWVQFERTAQ